MFKSIIAGFSKKLITLHIAKLAAPVVMGASVGVAGLVLALQPMPASSHTKIHTQKVITKKVVARQTPPVPKVVQPTPAPVPATPPPSSPTPAPAPVKKAVPAAGTPKPEPVVTPSPGSSVSGLTPTAPAPNPTPQAPSSQTTTGYTSLNWSGYLAANGTFTGVSGSWIATNPTGNGSSTSADSSWIGIGGVTAGDLIQVGTQNIVSASGQVSTSAFYEMLPDVSQPVPGMTVAPGDSMTASISEIGSGQWTINITDKTNGQSYALTVAYASSLSSAEWIEEDPSYVNGQLIPFDNFHQAAFSGGTTVYNGASVNIAASTAQPVTMVNSNGQTIAVPSAIGGDGASFTVTP